MNIFVPIALFGWIPVVLLLFALLPARWAFMTAYLGAWMFLPMAMYPLSGLPDYGKVTATNYAVLLATVVFHSKLMLALRFRWFDIPMVIWCLCPMATAMSNDLTFHDGLSTTILNTMIWGCPYFLSRIYFTDWSSLRVAVVALIVAGAIYVPLCLWEIRMSPGLHTALYGYHQHSFAQSKRGAYWRPTVFMQHGLAVAMFMASAALAGFWLWRTRFTAAVAGIPLKWLVPVLMVTVVISQSHLATLLMLVGVGVMSVLRTSAGKWVLMGLLLIAPTYILARTVAGWDGQLLLDVAQSFGQDRARSLGVRIKSENLLSEKALQRPVFGWSAFGRYSVPGAVPDAMWVITLGKWGLLGLFSFTFVLLLPPLLMLGWPTHAWKDPALAPALLLALLLVLHMTDNLMNAMVNPLYMIFAGALGPVVYSARDLARRRAAGAAAHQRPGARQQVRTTPVLGAATSTPPRFQVTQMPRLVPDPRSTPPRQQPPGGLKGSP